MKFKEKLSRLIGDEPQINVARRAGLRPTTLSNFLIRDGAKPSADNAVRLAKALGCDVGWLIDDSLDWSDKYRHLTPERKAEELSIDEKLSHLNDAIESATKLRDALRSREFPKKK